MIEYVSPYPLQDGDKIALIAPSSPISSMPSIKQSIDVFRANNLEPVLGPNITHMRSENWSSASLPERIKEIEWAFSDDSINGIVCAEGGYSAIELLPYLPYDLISKSRKVFMGMSDVTVINNAILCGSKLINFLGPNARIRNDRPKDSQNLDDALKLLKNNGSWNLEPWKRLPAPARCICPGIAKGKAVGGNLTVFTALVGTPYIPDIEGAVLFFEDIYAGGYEVSMALNHLDLAGIFDKASAVVFGNFEKIPNRDSQDMTIEDVIVKKFADRMPCVYGLNFSHGDLVATIPLGVDVVVDCEQRLINFGNPYE